MSGGTDLKDYVSHNEYETKCGAGPANGNLTGWVDSSLLVDDFKAEQPEVTLEIIVTPERLRNLLSKSSISQATTKQAEAFMLLYSEQLEEVLQDAIKTFVTGKMK
jgi:hypothetical protein